ncbi:MAG: MFS transporter [Candidatus Deferrimicrobium sp.]
MGISLRTAAEKTGSGVVFPLAVTLAVQALIAMASITVPVLAPVASGDTGIPLAYLGVFMSFFYVGGMVSSLVSGDFILRYGPIRISQCCLVLCGLGLAATAAGSVPLMVLGALLIGAGYGPVTPASSHILVRTAPPGRLSLTFSLKQTGVPLGGAMAGALVPSLVLFYGWKGAAIAVGAGCVLLAFLSELPRAGIDIDRETGRPISFKGVTGPLKMVISMKPLRELAMTSFFFASMQFCLSTYLVSFLTTSLGVPLVRAGLTLTVALGAGVAGRIVWGGIADRLIMPRRMLGTLGLVMSLSAAATFFISLSWPYAAIVVLGALFGASAVGWNGVYLAQVAHKAPSGMAGVATGGTLFFTYFGGVIAPPLFGGIAGAGHRYSLAYFLFAFPVFLFSLLLFRGGGSR